MSNPASSANLYSLISSTLATNGAHAISQGMLNSVLASIVASYPNTTDGLGQYTSLGTIVTPATWNGSAIGLAYGGTGTSISATLGGVVYSGASVPAVSAANSTASKFFLSGASAAPTWSTALYPTTIAANTIVWSPSANTIGGLATSNSGVLTTSSSSVPSFTPTPTLGISGTSQGSLAIAGLNVGSVTVGVQAAAGSTPFKLPATNGSPGSHLKTDGAGNTSWTAAAYPSATATNQLLYSSATNQIAAVATASFGILATNSLGVPSLTASPSLGTNGIVGGAITLAGATSGSATIAVPAATGNTTFNLPPSDGVSTYLLQTDGNGNTSWGPAFSITSIPFVPQGRLTLASNTPVMTSALSMQGTVYYTPYVGATVPLWNGSSFIDTVIPQLSVNLTAAGAAASSVYDLFVWANNGNPALVIGPAWTNKTTRSAGTALNRSMQGVMTNSVSLASGPQTGYGSYVGTIATDSGGATVTWNPNTIDAAASLNVWNMYNRIGVTASVLDNGASYAYTGPSIRQARGSPANQINFVVGQREDQLISTLNTTAAILGGPAQADTETVGIGLNSTSSYLGNPGYYLAIAAVANIQSVSVSAASQPPIGVNFVASLEGGDGYGYSNFDVQSDNGLNLLFNM